MGSKASMQGTLGRLVGGTLGVLVEWLGLMTMLSFQFSLMQFSDKFLVHFTFKNFMDSSDPLGLLDSVYQLKGNTHTATAIQMVM